ncbi:MAG TPA: GNAT family N-acyltransferase [Candidatus Saccharimonadales bacterium]|nr:GNAT family N-acyltransferase [Candidatus Saccharimonadales bacterium]
MSTLEPREQSLEIGAPVFNGQPEDYWVGRIETADPALRQSLFDAAAKLRGQAYLELGYVSPDRVDHKGREIDDDDARSIHFTALERLSDGTSRIVGNSRLITKDSLDNPLPIERYFPEAFADNPIQPGFVEVSRLIAVHENPRLRHKIALALIRSMIKHTVPMGIHESYCIVEDPLLRLLNSIGIPAEPLGEPKFIPDQNGLLKPVRMEHVRSIDPEYMEQIGKTAMRNFFFDGGHGSDGFYDDSFIRKNHELR